MVKDLDPNFYICLCWVAVLILDFCSLSRYLKSVIAICCRCLGFMAVKRHHDQATHIKETIYLVLACHFGVSIYYHHGGKHVTMQAGLVLEVLTSLHLDQNVTLI